MSTSNSSLKSDEKSSKNGLESALKRFIIQLPDIRYVCLSTIEGADLMSVSRTSNQHYDDSQTVSSLVPSFSISIEQSTRLDLGSAKYSLIWAANSVILQAFIESVVVSIVMDETANIGIVEEHVVGLQSILRPYCSGLNLDTSH